MRSSRVLRMIAAAGLLAACGDDNNGPSGNTAPTAGFTVACVLLECTFTNTSTDADGTIATHSWDFGDGSAAVTTASPVHTYAAGGTYDVILTVTDNDGASDDGSASVLVSAVAPTANFTFSCSDLACDFTDESSDADGSVASRSWDFGDAGTSTEEDPQHTYTAAGTFDVTLTVTDNAGQTGAVTKPVTVTAPPAGGPTASFTVACTGPTCTVTNTTTGATGAVVTWAWDFGDGQTSTEENPAPVTYTVDEITAFTITLMVTSDGLTSQATRQVNVSPPAGLTCDGVSCTLGIDQDAVVVVTLTSSDCEATGNTFLITAPIEETLFTDGCNVAPGTQYTLNSGAAFTAGTQLEAEVRTGLAGAENPQLRVSGTFLTGWTLEFDDGFVGPNEPDFNDLVITIVATPQ